MSKTIDRRLFLGSTAAALAASAQPNAAPNVLFIVAGQWRAQTLPGADPNLVAPNLQRLASEAIRFDRAYASYPLATPSRASLMTGRFPHACKTTKNDVQLPLTESCIADAFKRAGYATAFIGQWSLDGPETPGFVPPGPRRRGFDYWAAFNRGYRYFDSIYFRDTAQEVRPSGFEPDTQTDLAIDFISKNHEKPYYLVLSLGPPHPPRTPPARTAKLYDEQQFALRENVPANYIRQARAAWAGYYAMCSALDECIGRLMPAAGGNTIVVFTSDHGDMLGSHELEGENLPYEESARVPLVVRYRKLPAPGSTRDLLISNVDLMPTLLSFCGIAVPESVQGRDLSTLIATGKGEKPQSVFVEGQMGTPAEWRMLVRGYDKLVTNAKGDVLHQFNLAQDPFEMEDLALIIGHSLRVDELKALLTLERRRVADGVDPSGLRRR